MSSSSDRIDIAVDGGSLAVFQLGDPGASRLVLAIHGITASSRAWLALARQLEGRAALLAPDLRGRGRSNQLGPPYGIGAHVRDLLAVLDHFELERAVVAGHSLGAYIAARLAAEHPDRVAGLVLVDGGLTVPGFEGLDPQAVVEAVVGPAVARLTMTFPTRQAYRDWWHRHPAVAGIADQDLDAYADHDLAGVEPQLRSAVSEDAVRGDAAELFSWGEPAQRLRTRAHLLCAPRGLLNDPNPVQPLEVANGWARRAPDTRQVTLIPDVNHYTMVMAAPGAAVVADAIVTMLVTDGPPVQSRGDDGGGAAGSRAMH